MAADAIAAQSAPDALGAGAAPLQTLVAQAPHLSSLPAVPPRRHHLRQEPDAVIPLVRIRGGGRAQSRSLLRLPVVAARASWLAPHLRAVTVPVMPTSSGQQRPAFPWAAVARAKKTRASSTGRDACPTGSGSSQPWPPPGQPEASV